MGDRVHPTADSPPPPPPPPPKFTQPPPAPGTYVIQLPKDQIYRYPPPENTRRLQKKKPRRCRCFCWTLSLLIILVVLAAGIFYLIFRPESPKYSIDDIAIRGLNLTLTSSSPITPNVDITVTAHNPNNKIAIYYGRGSSVNVYYSGINLCNGALPPFYQPSNNRTVFVTSLKGSTIALSNAVHSRLVSQQRQRSVPLSLNLRLPVKLKVGAVKTWTLTLKVKCELRVDRLTADSRIVSNDCDYSAELW